MAPLEEAILIKQSITKSLRKRCVLRALAVYWVPERDCATQMADAFVGMVRGMSMWRFSRIILSGPESSVFDLPSLLRGMRFSTYAMWEEVSALNLLNAAPVNQYCNIQLFSLILWVAAALAFFAEWRDAGQGVARLGFARWIP